MKENSEFKNVNKAVWDCLNDEDYSIIEGSDFALKPNYCENVWDAGCTLFKMNGSEDEEDWEEIDSVSLDDYGYTFADLLESGKEIVESMTNDIIEEIESLED